MRSQKEPSVDFIHIAMWATGISLIVAIIGAGIVVSRNVGSSTLAISTAALVGTAVVFGLQMYFELQRSADMDHVSTNFTLDASVPSIRQWEYPLGSLGRASAEVRASSWLKDNNAKVFDIDRDKLFSDFTIFSFVSFLMQSEFDWQLRRVEYPALHLGTSVTLQPTSKDKECAIYRQEDVRAKLKTAGNLFADSDLGGANRLCLPPDTTLEISPHSITFENHFCRAMWKLDEIPISMSHMKPGSQGDVPMTASGKPQFDSRVSGLNAEVTYFALRAKSPAMQKHKAWITRLMIDSHTWFESK